MPGRRSNISPLDEKILRFLFYTNKYHKDSHKSTTHIKTRFNESGITIIKKLERLREYGLVKKFEYQVGSRIDKYWCITNAGRYCFLAKLNDRAEFKDFIEGSIRENNYSPSRWRTSASFIPDYWIISRLILDRNWDVIDELKDMVRNCVDKYRYRAIMYVVRSWFIEVNGRIPTNLKTAARVSQRPSQVWYRLNRSVKAL